MVCKRGWVPRLRGGKDGDTLHVEKERQVMGRGKITSTVKGKVHQKKVLNDS